MYSRRCNSRSYDRSVSTGAPHGVRRSEENLQGDVEEQEKDTSAEAGVVNWRGADILGAQGGFETEAD